MTQMTDDLVFFDVPRDRHKLHGVWVEDDIGRPTFLPFMSVLFRRPSAEFEGGMEVFVRSEKVVELGIRTERAFVLAERERAAQLVTGYLYHPNLAGNDLALFIINEIATAIRSQP